MPPSPPIGSSTVFPSRPPLMIPVSDQRQSLYLIPLRNLWWTSRILTLRGNTGSPSWQRMLLGWDLSHHHTFLTVPLLVGVGRFCVKSPLHAIVLWKLVCYTMDCKLVTVVIHYQIVQIQKSLRSSSEKWPAIHYANNSVWITLS